MWCGVACVVWWGVCSVLAVGFGLFDALLNNFSFLCVENVGMYVFCSFSVLFVV